MNQFAKNLKNAAIENPLVTIVVVAAAVTAASRLINAAGHARGSNAYAKQVNAKLKNSK